MCKKYGLASTNPYKRAYNIVCIEKNYRGVVSMDYTLIESIQVGDYIQTNFTNEKNFRVNRVYYNYVIVSYDWKAEWQPYFMEQDTWKKRVFDINNESWLAIKIDEITRASCKHKVYYLNGKMIRTQAIYDRKTNHKLSQTIGKNLRVDYITNSKKYEVYKKYSNEIKNAQPQKKNEEYYGIIYIVMNKINKKMYIGQTKNTFKKRYNGSIMNTHNKNLLADLNKYGEENFIINEEYCRCYTKEELNEKEKQLIRLFKTDRPTYGYNIIGDSLCVLRYLKYERIANEQNVSIESIIKSNEKDYEKFMKELEEELDIIEK